MRTRRLIGKFIKKAAALTLAVLLLLPAYVYPRRVAAVSVPTDESMMAQVSTIYQRALDFQYARSGERMYNFSGWCSHYVSLQLMLLGVNLGYVGANGKDVFDTYLGKTRSTGGRKIHTIHCSAGSISYALREIASQCRVATNIVVGFQSTMTASGQIYGHAMLIHGLIDGYVYFTDNFATKFGNKSYAQGDPIKCTISEFEAFYGRPSVFTYEGVVWFEDEALTRAVNSGSGDYTPPDDVQSGTGTSTGSYGPGMYTVINEYGLRIRQYATTASQTLEVLPYGYEAYVTEVSNGFGRIFCLMGGEPYSGWISLDHTTKTGDLPKVCADTLGSGGELVSREWFNDLETAMGEAAETATVTIYGDCDLRSPITVGTGRTLKLGSYSLTSSNLSHVSIGGGRVTADKPCELIEKDPFVRRTGSAGSYGYVCDVTASVTAVSFSVANNPELIFRAETNLSGVDGITVELECEGFGGKDVSFPMSGSDGGILYFNTSALPMKMLDDRFYAKVVMKKTVDGHEYRVEGSRIAFNPAENLGGRYSKDSSFDPLIISMLNYAAEAQKSFSYSSDRLANRYLPASERTPSNDLSLAVRALTAPEVPSSDVLDYSGIALSFGDKLSISLRPLTDGREARLLVFSHSEYEALKAADPGASDDALLCEANCSRVLTAEGGVFRFSDFSAKQYADTFYFRLVSGDGDERIYSRVLSYSVTTYCEFIINNGIEENIDGLCRAVCDYSAAARAYFGYEING